MCLDQIIRRCVSESEIPSILQLCHSSACGGHFGHNRTARKVLESGLYWPEIFKDLYAFCKACDHCQQIGNVNQRHEMPQTPILVCEIFDIWGINFMSPFSSFFGNQYILLDVDYVSKWVEAKATRTNDTCMVVNVLKANIFARFGMPKFVISDRGTHFCN